MDLQQLQQEENRPWLNYFELHQAEFLFEYRQ